MHERVRAAAAAGGAVEACVLWRLNCTAQSLRASEEEYSNIIMGVVDLKERSPEREGGGREEDAGPGGPRGELRGDED